MRFFTLKRDKEEIVSKREKQFSPKFPLNTMTAINQSPNPAITFVNGDGNKNLKQSNSRVFSLFLFYHLCGVAGKGRREGNIADKSGEKGKWESPVSRMIRFL